MTWLKLSPILLIVGVSWSLRGGRNPEGRGGPVDTSWATLQDVWFMAIAGRLKAGDLLRNVHLNPRRQDFSVTSRHELDQLVRDVVRKAKFVHDLSGKSEQAQSRELQFTGQLVSLSIRAPSIDDLESTRDIARRQIREKGRAISELDRKIYYAMLSQPRPMSMGVPLKDPGTISRDDFIIGDIPKRRSERVEHSKTMIRNLALGRIVHWFHVVEALTSEEVVSIVELTLGSSEGWDRTRRTSGSRSDVSERK